MDIHNIAGLEEEEYMPPESALQVHVDFYYINRQLGQNETTGEVLEPQWPSNVRRRG